VSEPSNPRGWWNRLIHFSVGLLVISVALTFAVQLLESIRVELIIAVVVGLVASVIRQIHRIRQSRW
jgi:hypothetical protein